jgi:hypothetical protein
MIEPMAAEMAISPDNSKVAIGYGIRVGNHISDGVTHVGVYALEDGRFQQRFTGGKWPNGFWLSLRSMDVNDTSSSPMDGLLWAPDSRRLFLGSRGIYEFRLQR